MERGRSATELGRRPQHQNKEDAQAAAAACDGVLTKQFHLSYSLVSPLVTPTILPSITPGITPL